MMNLGRDVEQITIVLECEALTHLCALLEKTEDTETILLLLKSLEDILETAKVDDQLESLLVSCLMLMQEEIVQVLKRIETLQHYENEEIQRISLVILKVLEEKRLVLCFNL